MIYDNQLVGGMLLLLFGFVGMANAFVDKRSPLYSLIVFLVGVALVGWAWMLSGQMLSANDVPNAVYRVLSYWF